MADNQICLAMVLFIYQLARAFAVLSLAMVQVLFCDWLKCSLKLEYMCPDSEQMAEYNPLEAFGVAKKTPAWVLVQLCDWLKLGYRWLDSE